MSSTNSGKLYPHYNNINGNNYTFKNNHGRPNSDYQSKFTKVSKKNEIKNIVQTNGIFTSKSNNRVTTEAFINTNPESFSQYSLQNPMLWNPKVSLSSKNLTLNSNSLPNATQKNNTEPEMPNLIRETDTDQRNSSLAGSSVFNQRYQNVKQFPNYRQRKKCAFERKLKRCGLELNEEVTISILRQFLQPFIYREINTILESYIAKYFLKAFENIRENINITSENWSQILKCSISKSLYKQFCVNATIDPFDPQYANLTDFPCFPTVCKTSSLPNHKLSGVLNDDVVEKSNANCDTLPDISETFSEASTYSEADEHFERTNPFENVKILQCNNRPRLNSYSHSDPIKNKKLSRDVCRKRHIETAETKNSSNCHDDSLDNSFHKHHFNGTHLNPQNNFCHSNRLPRNTAKDSYLQFYTDNNCQNSDNLSEMGFEATQPNTGSFDNKDISFFQTPKLSSISSNSSLSAMQSDYLNSPHRSFEHNETSNHCFQRT